jgi:chromosome segregation ATPase
MPLSCFHSPGSCAACVLQESLAHKKDEAEALKADLLRLRASEDSKSERIGQVDSELKQLQAELSRSEKKAIDLAEELSTAQRALQAANDAAEASRAATAYMQQVNMSLLQLID